MIGFLNGMRVGGANILTNVTRGFPWIGGSCGKFRRRSVEKKIYSICKIINKTNEHGYYHNIMTILLIFSKDNLSCAL